VVPAATTLAAVLDAIHTAGTAATYYDGAARTPGSGSAWTWGRYQDTGVTQSVYATPPSGPSGSLNNRVIYSGATVVKTPTMLAPDVWQTNKLLMGCVKNAGAFSAWDSATPFTVGQFSGYWGVGPANLSSTAILNVYLIESQETVWIALEIAGNTCYVCGNGALWDPGTTFGLSPLSSEADGRRYGMTTSNTTLPEVTWYQSNYGNTFLNHGGASSDNHTGVMDVGSSSVTVAGRSAFRTFPSFGGWGYDLDMEPVLIPIYHFSEGRNYFVGRLRECCFGPASRMERRIRVGGVDRAYALSRSLTVDSDPLWLQTS